MATKRIDPKPSTVYISRDRDTYLVQVYDSKGTLVREQVGISTRMHAALLAARTAAVRGFDLIDETQPPRPQGVPPP